MTMQMDPALPQLIMLVAVLTGLVGMAWVAVRAIRRRPTRRGAIVVLGGGCVYLGALLVVSVASGSPDLRPGDTKCFDEWCVTMVSARIDAEANNAVVQARLDDRGRGAQRSILARAFIEAGGHRTWPENESALQTLVPGGGTTTIAFKFRLPGGLQGARFVVTEAASGSPTPAALVIGDESSPLHGLAGWPLTTR